MGADDTGVRSIESNCPAHPIVGTEMTGDSSYIPERQEKLPASKEVVEVAPGVLRMQLPIELPGLRHVNCYALPDPSGITLIDPGIPGPQSWKALNDRMRAADMDLQHVHTILITHSHPDHFGNAMRIRELSGARIVTHSSFNTMHQQGHVCVLEDCDDPAHIHADTGQVLPQNVEVRGFDQPAPWGGLWSPQNSNPELRRSRTEMLADEGWALPTPTARVRSGERLPIGDGGWTAVHTPGHTIDHLCFFHAESGTVVTGDHVLPTITPHISGIHGGSDPLRDFFASLDMIGNLPNVQVGLPAHGGIVPDVPVRCKEISEHHVDRMRVLAVAAEAEGWADVPAYSRHLFRPERQGSMADSETYAHLAHLEATGLAARRVRDDGSHEFIVTASP
jgi:glyoxylase-like metal-dependent hydrolase (beta-lactamase superfamily II)